MCITYVSYLPTVGNGRVQQLKNTQMAGISKWVLRKNSHILDGWQPSKARFYGYLGCFEELWSPISEGDQMQYETTTSASPAISSMVWREGHWWAWVLTARCGIGHWTLLAEDASKAQSKPGAFCDGGFFCPDAHS